MGDDGFETWLSMIGRLDGSQRRRALCALALAQAADAAGATEAAEVSSSPGDVGASDDAAVRDGATPRTMTRRPAVDENLLGKLGRDRIASFGCPHCSAAEVRRWGRAGGKPRYRCVSCGKTFNLLTGTPLAGLHHPERWADQAQALIAGETVSKAAERCRVAYTTAFRWRHRFLAALNLDKPQRLSGIVEADETFILESFKGKRGKLARPARKQGGKASKRGLSSEQIPVLVARDRSGATFDAVLPRLDIASMTAVLGQVITRGSETVLRRRPGDRRICPARWDQDARAGRPRRANARCTAVPHQQRQRLPQPPEGMDAPLPRRRHRQPAQLPQLATNHRSFLKHSNRRRMDQSRRRLGTISTEINIKAISNRPAPHLCWRLKR